MTAEKANEFIENCNGPEAHNFWRTAAPVLAEIRDLSLKGGGFIEIDTSLTSPLFSFFWEYAAVQEGFIFITELAKAFGAKVEVEFNEPRGIKVTKM